VSRQKKLQGPGDSLRQFQMYLLLIVRCAAVIAIRTLTSLKKVGFICSALKAILLAK
jgi:hypothetical protein